MDTPRLDDARRFIHAEGRLLERRLLASLFDGEDAAGVHAALMGYRNDDGGFGHGLEPDKRAPSSQPLDVECAFQVMDMVGRVDHDVVTDACGFLAGLGTGVGCLTPEALEWPRAPHWGEWALEPDVNPTAGIAALLWKWDIGHPWRDAATEFCWASIADGLPAQSHGFSEVLSFLDWVPDERVGRVAEELPGRVAGLELFRLDPAAPGYGMTPLHFAPSPDSRWIGLFEPATIEAHLDALVAAQCDDGGWPISWETIGAAAVEECRGAETLRALRVLSAFGRLG